MLAAVQVAPETTELREFPLPDVAADAALLKVEAAGVCGSDVGGYKRMGGGPKILGHENVGTIAQAGSAFARRWGVAEGDRVAIEEYLPCGHCELCLRGEFRHCAATDVHSNPQALRYGSTPSPRRQHCGAATASTCICHPRQSCTACPPTCPPSSRPWRCRLVTACNGRSSKRRPARAGPWSSWAPDSKGLAAVLASKVVGADLVILTGLSRDERRLDVGRQLGADVTIVADQEDVRERVREITSGKGVDAVVDTTSAPASEMVPLAIDLVKRKEGRIVVQSIGGTIPDFPIEKLARKYITLKAARGHSYASVELAIQWIASGKFPLDLLTTHHFGLDGIDLAIKSTGGTGLAGAIHVTVLPWVELRVDRLAVVARPGGGTMKYARLVLPLVMAASLFGAACSPPAAPAPPPAPTAQAAAPQAAAASDWNAVVAAAKQEGKLVLSTHAGTGYEKYVEAVKQALPGLTVEATTIKASDFTARVVVEQQAGQYLWDVHMGPVSNVYTVLTPANDLQPIKPFLDALPADVKDDTKWAGGFGLFTDPNNPSR